MAVIHYGQDFWNTTVQDEGEYYLLTTVRVITIVSHLKNNTVVRIIPLPLRHRPDLRPGT